MLLGPVGADGLAGMATGRRSPPRWPAWTCHGPQRRHRRRPGRGPGPGRYSADEVRAVFERMLQSRPALAITGKGASVRAARQLAACLAA